jgi:hypothetical protein
MLIAAAAMFFAVAGSAFILRARMADSCCARATAAPPAATQPAATATTGPAPATTPRDCGRAIYERRPDGSTAVTFDLCP